jgi:hypothetical protein
MSTEPIEHPDCAQGKCTGYSAGRSLACDRQDGNAARWLWPEGRARQRASELGLEGASPAVRARPCASHPPPRRVPRDDDVGANEATSGSDETAQQRDGDRKRRVSHHSEGTLGQSQVAGIGSHNLHIEAVEAMPQCARPIWVKFHCDDPSSMLDKRARQRPGPCANINDEVAWPNSGVGHHLLGPTTIELMPPPACPFPGHGEPSHRTSHIQLIAEWLRPGRTGHLHRILEVVQRAGSSEALTARTDKNSGTRCHCRNLSEAPEGRGSRIASIRSPTSSKAMA